jgi:DNA polymerase-3 subunit epsilon
MVAAIRYAGDRGGARIRRSPRKEWLVKHLRLDRPLVVFDLETTGTDPATDKIVEISVLRIAPDGERELRTRRVNPGRPIPPGASAVHGIRDEDIREEPKFGQIARGLIDFLGDADLAGFNIARFDVPLLDRELREAGLDLGLTERRLLDAMSIYHRKERRDLSAAVEFYLDRQHAGAHSAEDDVLAAIDVLDAQLGRYEDIPRDVAELDAWLRPVPRDAVDQRGKFVWRESEVAFAFGKHQGRALREVAREAPDYLEWILNSDFPEDARQLVADALKGDFKTR